MGLVADRRAHRACERDPPDSDAAPRRLPGAGRLGARAPRRVLEAVIADLDIAFAEPYEEVLDLSRGPAWPMWFVRGRLNVVANCVERQAARSPDAAALRWENEAGERRDVSYAELLADVDALAADLRARGVGKGDTVAIAMPMRPEAVCALYAVMKLGAIAVPVFSGFSSQAIAARLDDAGIRLLLTCEETTRSGRRIAIGSMARAAAEASGTAVLTLPLNSGGGSLETIFVDSEHPLMLNYTSGTTGAPKAAVHVHGGFLVKVASEAAYLTDLHADDTILWITDLGWLMGPWTIIGAHAAGACVLLYEGAPDHPDPSRLWDLCRDHEVSVLGLSPTLARLQQTHWRDRLSELAPPSLRLLASTGEPWDPASYEWLSRSGRRRLATDRQHLGRDRGGRVLSRPAAGDPHEDVLGGASAAWHGAGCVRRRGQAAPRGRR